MIEAVATNRPDMVAEAVRLRTKEGMPQCAIAERLGVDPSTVSVWMTNHWRAEHARTNVELGDDWPRQINGVLVEPASGVVRIRRRGQQPIEVPTPDMRELAEIDDEPVRKQCLLDAIAEAERQLAIFLEMSRPPEPIPDLSHCDQGHKMTPANTYVRMSGVQRCRECERLSQRQRRAARKDF